MKVYILLFLVPAVLGTGTKPFGADNGVLWNRPYYNQVGNRPHDVKKESLFGQRYINAKNRVHAPLSASRPYYNKDHVFGNRPYEDAIVKPLSGNRPYTHHETVEDHKFIRPYQGKFFGNRPYYGAPSKEFLNRHHSAVKPVVVPKVAPNAVPMGNRRHYDIQVPTVHMGNRPYYGKEQNTVLEEKIVAQKYIPMGNRRSYEKPEVPQGNRPYYGKAKNEAIYGTKLHSLKHKNIQMGN